MPDFDPVSYMMGARSSGGGGGGDSDFFLAEVTLINSLSSNRVVILPLVFEADEDYPEDYPASVYGQATLFPNEPQIFKVPIYKNGSAYITKGQRGDITQGTTAAVTFAISGDAADDGGYIAINGDCTITVTG